MNIKEIASLCDEEFNLLNEEWISYRKQKTEHEELLNSIKHANNSYVENHLSQLSFLEPEKKRLLQLLDTESNDDLLRKKVFLNTNQMKFKQELLGTFPIKEILLSQTAPVLLNDEDLKKLLCYVEGFPIFPYLVPEGKPPLMIKNFSMHKQPFLPYQNVFEVQMNLITKEKS